MSHTPGPWHLLDEQLRPTFPVRILEVQDASGVAVVKWGGFDGVDRPKSETKANARLIAAAPDLLASCRELREALAGAMRVLDNELLDDVFVQEMAAIGITDGIGVRADAAIKKADGR